MTTDIHTPSPTAAADTSGLPRTLNVMTDRVTAVEQALASTRLEGLDPSEIEPVLWAWARGELTDAQLQEAKLRAAAGEPLDDLLPAPAG